ncbi:MAG TPA: twin-arginine translocation signal domain-containing protein [Candidatus Acidoferrum sp.]|jgi:hypothetical protein|nr:twin-arginine translocation signal domain-containing protein [Candidatus Acidoferrum sp.]
MTSRRQFLTGCSALTLTASLAPAACLSALLPVRKVTLDQIRFAAFSEQVGTIFSVGQKPVELKLVGARLIPTFHPPDRVAEDACNEKFSLQFSGSRDLVLNQNTYTFEHPGIGRFDMFIVPVAGMDSSRSYYYAIFNRSAPETTTSTRG